MTDTGQRSLEALKRIQVGCGPANLMEDWWNVDIRSFPGIDQTMDVTRPWSLSSSLDFVYGEHFLEHLYADDALAFLREAAQALRPGGRIRLSTPGLEWVLRTHFKFPEADDDSVEQTFAINRAFHGWGHRFLYSKASLSAALRSAGFEGVAFFAFGESDTPALQSLERHGKWSVFDGYPNTWIVEGRRPDILTANDSYRDAVEEKISRYVRSGH